MEKDNTPVLGRFQKMPLDISRQIMELALGQLLVMRNPSDEEIAANVEMHSLMYLRSSIVDTMLMLPLRWNCFATNPLQSEDRLGCKDFPIAIAFGDRDFFGSEGAD